MTIKLQSLSNYKENKSSHRDTNHCHKMTNNVETKIDNLWRNTDNRSIAKIISNLKLNLIRRR